MPKKYFKIEQISKAEYFKQAEAAGNPEDPHVVHFSSAGSFRLKPKTYLAYTSDTNLAVDLEEVEQ